MSDTDEEELDKEAVGRKVSQIVLFPPSRVETSHWSRSFETLCSDWLRSWCCYDSSLMPLKTQLKALTVHINICTAVLNFIPPVDHCVFRLPRSCQRRSCRSTRTFSPTSTETEGGPLERRSSTKWWELSAGSPKTRNWRRWWVWSTKMVTELSASTSLSGSWRGKKVQRDSSLSICLDLSVMFEGKIYYD